MANTKDKKVDLARRKLVANIANGVTAVVAAQGVVSLGIGTGESEAMQTTLEHLPLVLSDDEALKIGEALFTVKDAVSEQGFNMLGLTVGAAALAAATATGPYTGFAARQKIENQIPPAQRRATYSRRDMLNTGLKVAGTAAIAHGLFKAGKGLGEQASSTFVDKSLPATLEDFQKKPLDEGIAQMSAQSEDAMQHGVGEVVGGIATGLAAIARERKNAKTYVQTMEDRAEKTKDKGRE